MKNKAAIIVCAAVAVLITASIVYYRSPLSVRHVDLGDEKYRAAYENCIDFLKNESGWPNVPRIDMSAVKIEPLGDKWKQSVHLIADGYDDYFANNDAEHWVFTIGSTQGHDFAIIVCDGKSGRVIGYIPIA